MSAIRYAAIVRPAEFFALAQRVWPGDYGLAEATDFFDRIGCERRLTGFAARHPLP